ncbi:MULTISPECIES: Crp/Fnr family transcriptional regulator [Sphingobacterium]|uniref:Crp/Fnr family transcriptional regulator n=1 Tax=Sphingobacterium TaxID=28453 RepID=UPI0010470679|nr:MULTISPECIES: Crp/Fnr family transcriptional regulator [Sphingobacterium]MCW2263161.1 CRP-like cAMP-binding protein [Sphingobacterium kitahiroshimense]TCR11855.1 CRP-like cAMP-binding protein [Sphingobacterium sp. JUb78]
MIYHYITEKFSHFNLNEEEIYELSKILTFKKIHRKEILFCAGERVNTIALIVKGSVYGSILNVDGVVQITSFHYPSSLLEIVFNYEDYLLNNSSQMIFRAYDDALLLLLDIAAVKRLYEKFPRFYQLELMIMEPNLVMALKNVGILQAKTATDKIKLLKDNFPQIFQIFPYSYIASFLGIHRNTFNKVMTSI